MTQGRLNNQASAQGVSKTAAEMVRSLGSDPQTGLASTDAKARLALDGANEAPEQRVHALAGFARKFWSLSAWMIELIILLSFILHKYADMAVALALLVVNAILSFVQEQRASAAVTALRSQLRVSARVLRDGSWLALPARELVAGDIVRVRTGDFVPADVQILDGELRIDQSALTGESQEQRKTTDDPIYSGSIVRQGEATAVVVATGTKTYFGRTTELVQSARPKLHVEEVITRVVKWLLLIVGIQVAVALAVSLAKYLPLLEILPLALVLLMSAVPVALPVMFTVSMAVGSVELARRGILITRLSAAEDAASMNVLCADKTGTLTMNRLSLSSVLPQEGFTQDDVVTTGALASNAADQDPIDLAFLHAAQEHGLLHGQEKQISFVPFSPSTRRTEALVEVNGRKMRVMKGALRSVAEIVGLEEPAVVALEASAKAEAQSGMRALAVAHAEEEAPWRLVGLALLRDAPRPDSRQLIAELRSLGVAVKMLTGDALPVARAVAQELALGDVVRAPDLRATLGKSGTPEAESVLAADGFAEVFPEDKFLIVRGLQTAGRIVGMTGDGVNDAPALRQAEVGIAVAGSTDVAKGAASIVLTSEGLTSIVDLVKNGRAIYQRVLTWIVNKVSSTILQSGFVVIAFLLTGQFVIPTLGMVLLAFMTDFVKIALATDRTRFSQSPETWNIGPLVKVAVIIGLLMLIETLGLLAIGWRGFGLSHDAGRLQTFTFLTLLFFALFSIVSIRERHAFWASWPSWVLTTALAGDACIGIAIGLLGLAALRPLPIGQIGFVIAYALFFSLLVNDLVKSVLIRTLWNAPTARP